MIKGDAATTGKWVVLFNFWWVPGLTKSGEIGKKDFIRAIVDFNNEEDADIFYTYCLQNELVPTKRPRFNIE